MAVYKPLFVYLTPASIPQVVAHIQKYLADNPIISDPEVIAEAIKEYIEAHPEIIAVASVNGKTGNVVLTGSDININASSSISLETQLLNLASMIQSTSGDIMQIESQLETIYTNIGTLETNVSNNTSAISALQTSVEGQGTRIATAEGDIDALESAQSAQNTRLNSAEGNISSLQTRMTQAETDINNNKSSIETLQTNIEQTNHTIIDMQNDNTFKTGDIFSLQYGVMLSGMITTASKSIYFTLYLGKKINASNVTLINCSGVLRGVNGYIEGTGSHDFLNSAYSTVVHVADADCGIITIGINKSTEFLNATNNTSLTIEFQTGNLALSFS